MVRRAPGSPLQEEAQFFREINDRIARLERVGHFHTDEGWTEPELVALIEATGDPRWVNEADAATVIQAVGDPRWVNHSEFDGLYLPLTGGTLSGLLRANSNLYVEGQERVWIGATGQALVLAGTGGNAYMGIYPNGTNIDTVGTRLGYIGAVSNQLRMLGEGSTPVLIGTNAAERYYIDSAGAHRWNTSWMELLATAILQIGPSSDSSLRVARTGNAPFIAFYDTTFGTRYGYLQFTGASSVTLNAQSAPIVLIYTSGSENCRFTGGDFWLGKTASGLGTNGVQLFGTGHAYFTVGHNTASAVAYFHRQDTAVATSRAYCMFVENDAGVGQIYRAGAGATAYATSSDGTLKGNVQDLDDDEALERVKLWRPVAFQWKMRDGRPHADGEPDGDVEHGFIAQEMFEVNPNAVVPGTGTRADHDEWLERRKQYQTDADAYEFAQGVEAALAFQHAEAVEAWEAECKRIIETWQPVTERTDDDSGIVVVETHDEPVLPERPAEPEYPEMPPMPEDPGPSPYTPWMGDWTMLVPDLTAAVQALIRQNRALTERVGELEARIA